MAHYGKPSAVMEHAKMEFEPKLQAQVEANTKAQLAKAETGYQRDLADFAKRNKLKVDPETEKFYKAFLEHQTQAAIREHESKRRRLTPDAVSGVSVLPPQPQPGILDRVNQAFTGAHNQYQAGFNEYANQIRGVYPERPESELRQGYNLSLDYQNSPNRLK